MSIALITGLEFEAKLARPLVKEAGTDDLVLVAGLGGPFAGQVVEQAKKAGARGIVSFGVCGGLDPALLPGNIILPKTILAPETISVDIAWHGRLMKMLSDNYDIATGALLTAKTAVATTQEKAALFKKTAAVAVDMESAVLAHEAKKNDLSFIAVRVVHDPAAQMIPKAFRDVIKNDGQIDGWKLVRGLIFNWPGLKILKQVSGNDEQARVNLEGLTRLALPGFGLDS